jgi:hypothetical protein
MFGIGYGNLLAVVMKIINTNAGIVVVLGGLNQQMRNNPLTVYEDE